MKQIIVLFLRKYFIVYDVRRIEFQITLLLSIEMTKNRRFQNSAFELSKDNVTNVVSDKHNILLEESV